MEQSPDPAFLLVLWEGETKTQMAAINNDFPPFPFAALDQDARVDVTALCILLPSVTDLNVSCDSNGDFYANFLW